MSCQNIDINKQSIKLLLFAALSFSFFSRHLDWKRSSDYYRSGVETERSPEDVPVIREIPA